MYENRKLKWFFNGGKCYEEFTVLYNKGERILVQNDNTKKISFGLRKDFGTLCGFPVDWSCLTIDEARRILKQLVKLDNKYPDVQAYYKEHLGYSEQEIYGGMIDTLNNI